MLWCMIIIHNNIDSVEAHNYNNLIVNNISCCSISAKICLHKKYYNIAVAIVYVHKILT